MTDDVRFQEYFEYHDGSNWVDISDDVRRDGVSVGRGISSGGLRSRMAVPGKMSFTVLNGTSNSAGVEGYYTPYHLNCREGWGKGASVRLRFVADGYDYIKFKGEITDLVPIGDISGEFLTVIGEDILYKLRRAMLLPALSRNKTMEEGVALVLTNFGLTPDGGTEVQGTMGATFATIFDITRKDSSGLSEMSKLAGSELGYIALIGDEVTGEVLRLQSRTARAGLSVKVVPVGNENASKLVDFSGNQLVDYDGNSLVALETQAIDIADRSKGVTYGQNVVNTARVKMTPRRENDSLQVLFSLDTAPVLEPGESFEIIAAYSDPDAETQKIAAYSMQALAANTDYTANTEQDGSGDDRTSSLGVSAPEYGVKEAKYAFINNHATDSIAITKFQPRGYGVYYFQMIELIAEDVTDEVYEQSFTLDYVDDAGNAQLIADDIVAALKTPRTEVPAIVFDLENSWANYWAAIYLESGDKIPMIDSRFGLNGYAFVQGYSMTERAGTWSIQINLASVAVSTL